MTDDSKKLLSHAVTFFVCGTLIQFLLWTDLIVNIWAVSHKVDVLLDRGGCK
jgi:hypothetical protein